MLDRARSRGVGFSKFVSLGESADVDFGDVLDYLASDAETRAILLYAEAIRAARKFMSAARAAARNKPVLVVKAGRALGVARAIADPDNDCAEFAVIVRSDLKGRGLGTLLMDKLIDYCPKRHTRRMVGTTLGHNSAMLTLARRFGFATRMSNESELVDLQLDLHE